MNSARLRSWLLPLMLLGLVGLVLLMSLLTQRGMTPEPFANRSVFNSDLTGYKAWLLASQKAGLPIVPWRKPFPRLNQLPAPSTMLIVEPYTITQTQVSFGQQEVNALLAWVAQGNTVILLDDFQRFGSLYLLEQLEQDCRSRAATQPLRTLRAPHQIGLMGSFVHAPLRTQTKYWLAPGPQAEHSGQPPTVLLEDARHRAVLVRIPYRHGTLILGTPVDLGGNQYLYGSENDNFQFLSNLLNLEKKPVFVNEFVHGYTEITNIFAYLQQQTPLGAIFMQLTFVFLFALWLSFVPWTRRPPSETDNATPGKAGGLGVFIDSLAGIYYRTRAASLALGPQLSQIEGILRRRFRVSLDEEARVWHLLADLSGDYSNKDATAPIPETALTDSLKRAREVVRDEEVISHRELLKLSRHLSMIQERLEPVRTRKHRAEKAP